jgi:signal transduction histidine kinase
MADRFDRSTTSTDGYRRRLWTKLLVAFLVPTAVVIGAIGWLAYRAVRGALDDQLGETLVAIARITATQLGQSWTVALQPGDEGSRTYNNIKKKLEQFQTAAAVKSIYVFDRQKRALADSNSRFAIGEQLAALSADSAELESVFAGAETASVLFLGNDGRLYKTGFAPVRVGEEVVAAVGVDGSAAFFGPLLTLGQTLGLMSLGALVLVVLVSLLVSRRITRPLGRLARAAQAIGGGELERKIPVETEDEIGVLAHTLNEMRQSIRERDRQSQLMLSGIAHEVRNPLGGMALFVGLLREELADRPAALSKLARIGAELDCLNTMVNDFLDFARKRPIEWSILDPRQELARLHDLCHAELEAAQVTLDIDIPETVVNVRWDREKMHRALLNLVRNAMQASPAQARIVLSLALHDGHVQITVADQGAGIPVDKRALIFEPFFTTREKGTGLGLALARKIIEAHGGTISFESEVGRGTTFRIRLPQA